MFDIVHCCFNPARMPLIAEIKQHHCDSRKRYRLRYEKIICISFHAVPKKQKPVLTVHGVKFKIIKYAHLRVISHFNGNFISCR